MLRRTPMMLLCLLAWSPALAAAAPQADGLMDAPQASREAIEAVLKTEISKLLSDAGQLKGGGSNSRKIGPVTIKDEWRGEATFEDPVKKLDLKVTSFRRNDTRAVITATAKNPAAGKLHAGISNGPSIGTNFTATAELAVTLEVTWEQKGNETHYKPQVKVWTGKVSGTKFAQPIVKPLEGLVQSAANDWLNKNNDDLKKKANAALEKAAKEGRLKSVSE